jgi:hypothetical protein
MEQRVVLGTIDQRIQPHQCGLRRQLEICETNAEILTRLASRPKNPNLPLSQFVAALRCGVLADIGQAYEIASGIEDDHG